MPIDEQVIWGFVGGLVAVLGGVWTAYRLLGHAVYRELDQKETRLLEVEKNAAAQAKDYSERKQEQIKERYEDRTDASEARSHLSVRLNLLENEFRRWRDERPSE